MILIDGLNDPENIAMNVAETFKFETYEGKVTHLLFETSEGKFSLALNSNEIKEFEDKLENTMESDAVVELTQSDSKNTYEIDEYRVEDGYPLFNNCLDPEVIIKGNNRIDVATGYDGSEVYYRLLPCK